MVHLSISGVQIKQVSFPCSLSLYISKQTKQTSFLLDFYFSVSLCNYVLRIEVTRKITLSSSGFCIEGRLKSLVPATLSAIRMGRTTRSCLQSLLKVVNSIIGVVGISMILYSLWMLRVWQRDFDGSSFNSIPWFIYASLGSGITLCVITYIGHTAADTANSLCLSCYMVIIFFLLLAETTIIADLLLNSDWEKDLPEDPSGRFDDFKDFVKSNSDVCKWIGLLIVLAQGLSIFLAMILRVLRSNQFSYYDTDDDYMPTAARHSLLNPHLQSPPYIVTNPHLTSQNHPWKEF